MIALDRMKQNHELQIIIKQAEKKKETTRIFSNKIFKKKQMDMLTWACFV